MVIVVVEVRVGQWAGCSKCRIVRVSTSPGFGWTGFASGVGPFATDGRCIVAGRVHWFTCRLAHRSLGFRGDQTGGGHALFPALGTVAVGPNWFYIATTVIVNIAAVLRLMFKYCHQSRVSLFQHGSSCQE